MIKWFSENWTLKLFALFVAIGLWYYALTEEDIEVTRTVPLEIRLNNDQMSILNTSAQMVQVTLAAPRALLSDLTSSEIRAVHAFGPQFKASGDYSFRLEPREIKLPAPQIRVVKIEPEVINVALDELIVSKIEIKPNFLGEPAFGYKLLEKEIQLDPNAVMIQGPKRQLEKMTSIKTEPVDLVGRIRSFHKTVKVDLPDNVKPVSESKVDVFVPVQEEFDEKPFENIPVRVLQSADSNLKVMLTPGALSFVLKGSRRQIEKLGPEKIFLYLDVSSLKPGDHDLPVEMVLPEGVSLKQDKPLTVKAHIENR